MIPSAPGPSAGGALPAPVELPAPAAPAAAESGAPPAATIETEPLAYTFAGVPAGLVAGLTLLAVPAARRVRRYLVRLTALATAP